ncbi:MAG: FIST domain protein [halophilic archaeon J07HX64]|nr:MAG: FIST domain protein [halophilic archaeon J07HX64]
METVYTSGENLREVVRALGTDDNAGGIMLLTTPQTPVIDEVLSELPVPVFGGKFPAVIADGEKREQGSVVAKLETEPALTVVPNLSEQPSDITTSLTSETAPRSGTVFVFADAYATGIDRFIRKLFRTCGTDYNYIGGGAGTLDEQQPSIYTEDGLVQDAAVVASLDNSSTIGVQHGWKKLAGPFQVTDADGSTVNSLEHRPAFRVYQEAIDTNGDHNLTRDEFFDTAKEYPFGISRIDGEAIVRDPFTVDTDGAITCFGDVPEGEFVHILTGDTDSLVAAASEAHDEAVSDGSGDTLFFDCMSRVLYLEDEFDREIEAVNPEIGALTIGEIANDGCGHLDYYNKTAVVLSLAHN